MPDDRPMDRRRFFREGLRELLKPMAKAVEPIHRVATELGKLEPESPSPYSVPQSLPQYQVSHSTWLRPPGAVLEETFLQQCSRCAKCVDVCPAQCIKLDPHRAHAGGAPYIDVDTMPCILCTGLECMHHCPSGALLPTPLEDIDMGTAEWHEHLCVRSHGEDCTMCVDHCPMGSAALEVVNDRIVVHGEACAGCGVCQNSCPTDPKSITVTPRRMRPSSATS